MLPSATTADPVSAAELAQWLQSEWSTEVLVVDCRPFMVYNSSHIRSAHNVHCPPILKRRTGGAMPLENIVRCPKTRVKLLSGVFKSVVLYDDCTRCLTELSPDSNIAIVLKSIRNGAGFQSVYFLEDGFSRFKTLFANLCQTQPSSLPCDLMDCDLSPLPFDLAASPMTSPASFTPSCRKPRLRDTVKCHPARDQGDPVEVLPWLYLGNAFHAEQACRLHSLRISAILNVCSAADDRSPSARGTTGGATGDVTGSATAGPMDGVTDGATEDSSRGFAHKKIPIDDNCTSDVLHCFPEAIHFIDSVRRRRGRVLVHCLAGISRSATICIAYLMYHKRLPLEAAYDFVKCRRQLIAPNLNFMRQLVEFEQHVLATGGGGGGSGEGGSPPGSPEDGERVATPRFTLPLTPSCTLQAAAPSVFQFDVSPPATTATTYASNPLLSPG